jgi:predicted anti-sigma-YlaC factor YlaD
VHSKSCCKGLLPYITDFLEGDAGRAVCRRISMHLAGCQRCRMYVDASLGVIKLYKPWRSEPMPHGVKVRLRTRIATEMERRSARNR